MVVRYFRYEQDVSGGTRSFLPRLRLLRFPVVTEPTVAEKIASRILARVGIAAIWDAHVAAAAAYGLGKMDAAASLLEIADAAEREWLNRAELLARLGNLTRRSRLSRGRDQLRALMGMDAKLRAGDKQNQVERAA